MKIIESRNMSRKKIILSFTAACLAPVLLWLWGHSFINIAVDSSTNYSYTITSNSGEVVSTKENAKGNAKVLVKKGVYSIQITSGSSSGISSSTAQGLMRTKVVTPTLHPQSLAVFVGNNPSQCMNMASGVLISYECGGRYSDLNIHKPATNTMPTYITKSQTQYFSGVIEGVFGEENDKKMVVKKLGDGEGGFGGKHFIYHLKSNSVQQDETELTILNRKMTYAIKETKSGFIARPFESQSVYSFNSSLGSLTALRTSKSSLKNGSLVSDDFGQAMSASIYTTNSDGGEKNSAPSELAVIYNGKELRKTFKSKNYLDIVVCSTRKICLLDDHNTLEVYEVSSNNIAHRYSVKDIKAIRNYGSKLIYVNSKSVVIYDVNARTGYIDHDLEGYTYSNMSVEPNGYLLRLIGEKGNPVAILIADNGKTSDNIDKKIIKLQHQSSIKYVSIYREHIYIGADLGKLVYNTNSRSYSYDPNKKRAVAESINRIVDAAGIDRTVYQVSSNAF